MPNLKCQHNKVSWTCERWKVGRTLLVSAFPSRRRSFRHIPLPALRNGFVHVCWPSRAWQPESSVPNLSDTRLYCARLTWTPGPGETADSAAETESSGKRCSGRTWRCPCSQRGGSTSRTASTVCAREFRISCCLKKIGSGRKRCHDGLFCPSSSKQQCFCNNEIVF